MRDPGGRRGRRTAAGVHYWLRPLLADIAAIPAPAAHGIDLADRPRLTGCPSPCGTLMRPDRPEPVDRDAPGMTLPELTVLVDQLEAL